ncbi:AMP-binding protein [Brevibacterium sp. NPDC049920]|uniref:AMP-binding protein n=1 Tax=Brevibacterium sp. NPDC049920 TaxID=3155279 RepID=UPI0033D11EE6
MTTVTVEAAALALSRSPSLVGKLLRHAHEIPDAVAIRYRDEETSWRECADSVLALAVDFRRRGIRTGDRVAVLTTNRPEFLLTAAAAAALGAIIVPINFRLSAGEIACIVDSTDPQLLVTEPATAEQARDAPATTDSAPVVLECGSEEFRTAATSADRLPVEDLFVPAGTDDFVILHTSGTTGNPKGAVLSCLTVFSSAIQNSARWGVEPGGGVIMLAPPLFHIGSFMSFLSALARGATALVIPSAGFDPAATLTTMKRSAVSAAFMVPQQWQLLCEEIERSGGEGLAITHANWGGAPASEKLLLRMAECMPDAAITAVFGQTETTGTAVSLRFEDSLRKIGSVGKPTAETSIRIVDPQMNDVGVDGFIYVVDRLKDMIISGGENIYCAEIENALTWHPQISEISIVGRPDETWGEVPIACIVPKNPDDPPTLASIRDYLTDRLASYKHPKDIRILDTFPRSGMGKIQKTVLRDTVAGG